mmetsp:Transcript_39746/g.75996  ORF Transcript_39746/g.75996 Transcript_39746/m.75996 type:complete len:200 (+) Transcript_39746:416-1015(+)
MQPTCLIRRPRDGSTATLIPHHNEAMRKTEPALDEKIAILRPREHREAGGASAAHVAHEVADQLGADAPGLELGHDRHIANSCHKRTVRSGAREADEARGPQAVGRAAQGRRVHHVRHLHRERVLDGALQLERRRGRPLQRLLPQLRHRLRGQQAAVRAVLHHRGEQPPQRATCWATGCPRRSLAFLIILHALSTNCFN